MDAFRREIAEDKNDPSRPNGLLAEGLRDLVTRVGLKPGRRLRKFSARGHLHRLGRVGGPSSAFTHMLQCLWRMRFPESSFPQSRGNCLLHNYLGHLFKCTF